MEHAGAVIPLVTSVTFRSPLLLLIPGLPLAAFTLLILMGRRLGQASAWLAVGFLATAFGIVVAIADPVFQNVRLGIHWTWLPGASPASMGFAVDGMSWLMLFVVTGIGTLIALYSIGYMQGDPRFSRFFAYFSLFCASMLTLVLADHFVLLYAGWELVGLCSYLLISFWFEKPEAAAAGRKAFLTTRIGDTGLLLGILLLAWHAGSLQFDQLAVTRTQFIHGQPALLSLISALIFLGAVGKSAQIPLHVWLPDAMEGPTPVSALIHAATMVAAGVYLVARTLPLFTPESLDLVLTVGLATHLFAGSVALTMTDIKRILAYSTVSQLGLMMTALGLGAWAAAMFQLFTHAFFKALLFLAAGSVIHATHHQDLSQLGGLRRHMPWTTGVFLIAALSMSGFPLLSGFWSKDAILLAAHERPIVFWSLVGGAVMTASYVFRLYLRCFHGQAPKAAEHQHPHESPWIMVAPMGLLAAGAAVVGLTGTPWSHPVFTLLGSHETHAFSVPILIVSVSVFTAGVWLAWAVGVQHRNFLPETWRPLGTQLYTWAAHKYYIDEGYARWVIHPLTRLAQQLSVFDRAVIDAAVDATGRLGEQVSMWKERFDQVVVDRLVNETALTVRGAGAALRLVQSGVIQHYLLIVVGAVVVLSVILHR